MVLFVNVLSIRCMCFSSVAKGCQYGRVRHGNVVWSAI